MRRFTNLFTNLDATNSTTEKLHHLEHYFNTAPPADAAWTLALLTGNRPKGAASTRALHDLALETADIPAWLFDESYAAVGDLSETIALLLPEQPRPSDEPLHVLMRDRVLPLAGASGEERKRIIADAWRTLDSTQRFVYHKLIRGGFRLGVQKRLVTRALAHVAGVPQDVMARRLAGAIEPDPHRLREILAPTSDADNLARPYPFYLAHQLDDDPASLGDPADWQAEWKWDGIRAQLLLRDTPSIWSRGEEIITHQFPEIAAAGAGLKINAVLDGEILLWRDDKPLPFAALQKRLGRKTPPQPGLFDTQRAAFLAFDILEHDGEDIRRRPLRERRALLESLLPAAPEGTRAGCRGRSPGRPRADANATIRPSPIVQANTWHDLAARRAEARTAHGAEGLMLKHRDSIYADGRTKPDAGWWKWKLDPRTVDAVLVYSNPGTGRRAGLYTDHTFALWNDADPPALVPFAKAYSGLDQEEIERLDAWIRAHTTSKRGPFRAVEPTQVFEIAFENVQESDRHKSGLAVRFPRITKWRTDKQPEDADTLATLRAMLPSE